MIWKICKSTPDDFWLVWENERYFHLEKWLIEVMSVHFRKSVPFGGDMVEWMRISMGMDLWEPMTYFSVWNLILFLFFIVFPQKKITHIAETSLIICAVGGFYFAWVSPGHVFIWYIRLYIRGIMMKTMDLIVHQSPLWIFYKMRGTRREMISWKERLAGWMPIVLYLAWQRQHILELYSARWIDMSIIAFLSVIFTERSAFRSMFTKIGLCVHHEEMT